MRHPLIRFSTSELLVLPFAERSSAELSIASTLLFDRGTTNKEGEVQSPSKVLVVTTEHKGNNATTFLVLPLT